MKINGVGIDSAKKSEVDGAIDLLSKSGRVMGTIRLLSVCPTIQLETMDAFQERLVWIFSQEIEIDRVLGERKSLERVKEPPMVTVNGPDETRPLHIEGLGGDAPYDRRFDTFGGPRPVERCIPRFRQQGPWQGEDWWPDYKPCAETARTTKAFAGKPPIAAREGF